MGFETNVIACKFNTIAGSLQPVTCLGLVFIHGDGPNNDRKIVSHGGGIIISSFVFCFCFSSLIHPLQQHCGL